MSGQNAESSKEKEVVERLVEENLASKLKNYLKHYRKKTDAEGKIDIYVEKNKKGLFNSKMIASFDRDHFRYHNEDFKKLDDAINHLFSHMKETLSSQ